MVLDHFLFTFNHSNLFNTRGANMTMVDGKALPETHPRKDEPNPQCEAMLSKENAWYRSIGYSKTGYYANDPSDRCKFQSKYIIDGKHMCRKHAGAYVLDKLFPAV